MANYLYEVWYESGTVVCFEGSQTWIAAMEEEFAFESQWRQMEADCCMFDWYVELSESDPFFDPWGDL